MAVGDTLEEVYPQPNKLGLVRAQGLHIDAWAKLSELVLKDRTIKFILQMLLHNQMI